MRRSILAAAAFVCAAAAAQTFEHPRAVVAAGGGSSADASGALRISGTFAEPLSGGAALTSSGGAFAATGGFWTDARAPRDGLFREQFENAAPTPAPGK